MDAQHRRKLAQRGLDVMVGEDLEQDLVGRETTSEDGDLFQRRFRFTLPSLIMWLSFLSERCDGLTYVVRPQGRQFIR